MFDSLMAIVLIACLLILFHTWCLYLICVAALSRSRKLLLARDVEVRPISIVLTVHNEENTLEPRIENLLNIDYPADALEILVASDGSDDRTNEIVREKAVTDTRIRLLEIQRGGKSAAQNAAVAKAAHDLIVLTDAGTVFDRTIARNFAACFADPRVGCVTARLVVRGNGDAISRGHGLYWKFETTLRRLESRAGLLHTSSGAAMAFRKSLFRELEHNYGDDCLIPLDVCRSGYLVIQDDTSVAYDSFPSKPEDELRVRVRMTLRNITGTWSRRELLNPFRHPGLSFAIFSHKIFRWLTPYFLLAALVANLVLVRMGAVYAVALLCQIGFYEAATLGFLVQKRGHRIPVASHAYSFLLANVGFFLGVLSAVLGRRVATYGK